MYNFAKFHSAFFQLSFFVRRSKHFTFYRFFVLQLYSTVGMYSTLHLGKYFRLGGSEYWNHFNNFTFSCFYWGVAKYFYYFKIFRVPITQYQKNVCNILVSRVCFFSFFFFDNVDQSLLVGGLELFPCELWTLWRGREASAPAGDGVSVVNVSTDVKGAGDTVIHLDTLHPAGI